MARGFTHIMRLLVLPLAVALAIRIGSGHWVGWREGLIGYAVTLVLLYGAESLWNTLRTRTVYKPGR